MSDLTPLAEHLRIAAHNKQMAARLEAARVRRENCLPFWLTALGLMALLLVLNLLLKTVHLWGR